MLDGCTSASASEGSRAGAGLRSAAARRVPARCERQARRHAPGAVGGARRARFARPRAARPGDAALSATRLAPRCDAPQSTRLLRAAPTRRGAARGAAAAERRNAAAEADATTRRPATQAQRLGAQAAAAAREPAPGSRSSDVRRSGAERKRLGLEARRAARERFWRAGNTVHAGRTRGHTRGGWGWRWERLRRPRGAVALRKPPHRGRSRSRSRSSPRSSAAVAAAERAAHRLPRGWRCVRRSHAAPQPQRRGLARAGRSGRQGCRRGARVSAGASAQAQQA
jgi:hypothetical protein